MRLLVSACLLGLSCRYNGDAKENEIVAALNEKYTLIPFCPEIYGGLPTPREPAEIRDGSVMTCSGRDVTDSYEKGAEEALRLAKLLSCSCALLQDRSPSCGFGFIHDGTFSGGLIKGNGITAALLAQNGIRVVPVSQADTLLL